MRCRRTLVGWLRGGVRSCRDPSMMQRVRERLTCVMRHPRWGGRGAGRLGQCSERVVHDGSSAAGAGGKPPGLQDTQAVRRLVSTRGAGEADWTGRLLKHHCNRRTAQSVGAPQEIRYA
jgi:hypothetical protein